MQAEAEAEEVGAEPPILDSDEREQSATAAPRQPPDLPRKDVASGCIWPPVLGRSVLQELDSRGLAEQQPGGDWRAEIGDRWLALSYREHFFTQLDKGRQRLIEWARLHSGLGTTLSEWRCIALAKTGVGSWRLWQIVRRETCLEQEIASALRGASPQDTVDQLLDASRHFLRTAEAFAASSQSAHLRPTLESVGRRLGGEPHYVGTLPEKAGDDPPADLDTLRLLLAAPVAAAGLEGRPLADILCILDSLQGTLETRESPLVEMLTGLLIGA